MPFDPSVIGTIGDRATRPVMDAPARAYELGDLINRQQLGQMQVQNEKQTQETYGAIKNYIDQNKLDLSQTDDQNRLVAFATSRDPRVGMQLQREMTATQTAQTQLDREQLSLLNDKNEIIGAAVMPIAEAAQKLKAQGRTPQEINATLQPAVMQALQALKQQRLRSGKPVLEPEDLQKAANLVGGDLYTGVMGLVNSTQQARQTLQQYLRDQREDKKEARQEEYQKKELGLRGQEVDIKKRELKLKEDQQATESERESLIKAVGEYRSPPPPAGSRSIAAQRLLADVMAKYPNYDATNWQQKSKTVQAFASGQQGNTVRSLNVGVQHLGVLEQLSTALENKDTQAVNRLANYFSEQTGSAKVTNFDAAKQVVGDEIVKAVQGSGTAGALGDREEIKKQLNAAESPAQLAGVIKTYKQLMAGQLVGLRKQYTSATGLSNFDERLAPETISALESSPSPPSGAAAAGGTPPPAGAGPSGAGPKKPTVSNW